jgi:hypothetical protein
MHLLDTYALRTGSKISKPFILKKFFPMPVEKYITIQNSSGMPAKCYDYFQEVILYLKERLEKNGYRIVQIGSKDDKPLQNVINICGQTNINQTAFILNNSKLHIGNDSFAIHMASAFNVPCVGIYSITYPSIAGPYWNKNNSICLTPKNLKASFDPNENPKTINTVKIEDVINSVNKLLFSDNNKISLNSKYIGNRYLNPILETFPDQIIPPNLISNQMAHIRVDYTDKELTQNDYIGIINNLNIRECAILTDKKINLNPILNFKHRITQLIYNITKTIDKEFVKELFQHNINCLFVFENDNNEEVLNNRKFDLIEYPILIHEIKKTDKKIIEHLAQEKELFFSSKKVLYHNKKLYSSKYSFNKNIAFENNDKLLDIALDPKDIINMGEELEEFFIYSK